MNFPLPTGEGKGEGERVAFIPSFFSEIISSDRTTSGDDIEIFDGNWFISYR